MKLENIILPPYDNDLERLGLSMLYYDMSKLEFLDEDCFYVNDFKKIFNAIKKTNSTDFTTLAVESGLDNQIVLGSITELVSSSSFDYIILQLNKYKNARILIRGIQQLENQARVLEIDKAKETLQKIDMLLQDIEQEKTIEQHAMFYFEEIDKDDKWIKTGYKLIDDFISFRGGQLVVIAGRPSMGKTTIMQNIAIRQSTKYNVGFISMEMTIAELLDRFICILGGLTSYDIKNKKENILQIRDYLSPIMEKKLFLSDKIYSIPKIEQYIAKNDIDVCYIDYLGLINYGDAKMRIIDKISEITKQLKMIAKKRNCKIVLGCQLSREVEKRTDKRPILADLRDSGTIEQDADIVIMLFREDYYDEQTEKQKKIELIVRKNRNGELRTIELDSNFSSYRILDNGEIKKHF